jgi:hypothetical protein
MPWLNTIPSYQRLGSSGSTPRLESGRGSTSSQDSCSPALKLVQMRAAGSVRLKSALRRCGRLAPDGDLPRTLRHLFAKSLASPVIAHSSPRHSSPRRLALSSNP